MIPTPSYHRWNRTIRAAIESVHRWGKKTVRGDKPPMRCRGSVGCYAPRPRSMCLPAQHQERTLLSLIPTTVWRLARIATIGHVPSRAWWRLSSPWRQKFVLCNLSSLLLFAHAACVAVDCSVCRMTCLAVCECHPQSRAGEVTVGMRRRCKIRANPIFFRAYLSRQCAFCPRPDLRICRVFFFFSNDATWAAVGLSVAQY